MAHPAIPNHRIFKYSPPKEMTANDRRNSPKLYVSRRLQHSLSKTLSGNTSQCNPVQISSPTPNSMMRLV
eukprot:5129857-Amphidinium_carterae.1